MFFSTSYSAALAALLAEHDLGYIELVPQNPFAKELKEGVISAFRAGDQTPHFDQEWWVGKFNTSSRVVQLNFVALGLNELGHRPMLEEVWPRVRNPMVLNNIEKKLDKAAGYIEWRHGKCVRLRESRLSLDDWGLADQSQETAKQSTGSPDLKFVGALPDSAVSMPTKHKLRDLMICYYENPKTLGEKVGIPALFKYPHVAVVSVVGKRDPHLIVRLEDGGFDTPMLCSLDPSGTHRNFGSWSQTDRDSFIKKAMEIASHSMASQTQDAGRRAQRVTIACPFCATSLRVPKSRSGKISCPSCHGLFDVIT